jgi:hypothetical protein
MTAAAGFSNASWRVCRGGGTQTLRLVRPEDKELLREGFAQLSPTSRYLRFFAAKQDLTEAELVQLTELNGIDRLALGAVRERPDGEREGLGVARFARDPAAPDVADAAVTYRSGAGKDSAPVTIHLAEAAQNGIAAGAASSWHEHSLATDRGGMSRRPNIMVT